MEARSFAFTTLVIGNLGLILSNRVWSMNILAGLRYKNTSMVIIVTAALAVLALVLYVPSLRQLFRFGMLHLNDVAFCLGSGLVCILWFETVKYVGKKVANPPKA